MALLRACLLFSLLGAITACQEGAPSRSEPSPDPTGAPTPAGQAPAVAPQEERKPVATLTSEELFQKLKSDVRGTQIAYRDKLIEVKGPVRYLGPWTDKKFASVQLYGASGGADTVNCLTVDVEPWKRALPGQRATIVGTFEPRGFSPTLKEATITGVEGSPVAVVDTAKLAADLAADPKAVAAKYKFPNNVCLLFVGRFSATGMRSGSTSWLLEGPKDVKLELAFSPLLARAPVPPKAGQEIKFVATCQPNPTGREIHFPDSLIVAGDRSASRPP